MTKLDYDTVVSTLKDLVAEKGEEYVYKSDFDECVYSTPKGAPSCIVGHVIARLAPAEFAIIHKEEWGDSAEEGGYPEAASFDAIREAYGVSLEQTLETEALLISVQNAQDRETPWGIAVSNGIKYAEAL